jgi:hypothetical protein
MDELEKLEEWLKNQIDYEFGDLYESLEHLDEFNKGLHKGKIEAMTEVLGRVVDRLRHPE